MTKDLITEQERALRREAWRQANASVQMEGGIVDDEMLVMQERHILGEITREEYRAWAFEKTRPS